MALPDNRRNAHHGVITRSPECGEILHAHNHWRFKNFWASSWRAQQRNLTDPRCKRLVHRLASRDGEIVFCSSRFKFKLVWQFLQGKDEKAGHFRNVGGAMRRREEWQPGAALIRDYFRGRCWARRPCSSMWSGHRQYQERKRRRAARQVKSYRVRRFMTTLGTTQEKRAQVAW